MNLIPNITKLNNACDLRVNKEQIVAVKKDIIIRDKDNNYQVRALIWAAGDSKPFNFSFTLLKAEYTRRFLIFKKLIKYSTDDVLVHNKLYTNNLMDYFNFLSDLGIEDSCFIKKGESNDK